MRVFHDLRSVNLPGPTVLTVGNFDGIHRGHQALIRRLCALAAEARHQGAGTGATSVLVTFDPHPLAVLRPQLQHKLLTTPLERLELVAELGLDIAVLQPFTAELAQLDAREFVALLKTHLGMATLAVGPDFALGRQRSGNLETLRMLGKERGYDLVVMQPVDWQGRSVRSSTIRQALLEGNVAEAADLLGRCYRILGEVVRGDGRGRQVGIPTANLAVSTERLLPADGVYATRVGMDFGGGRTWYDSVTNIGVRPTVGGVDHRVETHVLDFPLSVHDAAQLSSLAAADPHHPLVTGDLYGRTLWLEFVARLRGERRFPGIDALVAQIHADIASARQALRHATLYRDGR